MLCHRQLGSTVRGLLPQRYGLTLILEQDTCLGAPLAVVYDGSQMADRALLATIDINNHLEETPALLVLLLAPDLARALALRKQAVDNHDAPTIMARYRALTRANALQLADILKKEACGMLVLPARGTALQHQAVEVLLEHLDLPVLLVT